MKKSVFVLFGFAMVLLFVTACKKKKEETPQNNAKLHLKFKFDSTQVRMDNFGNPVGVASGNAAQSPKFNKTSAHYVEFAQNMYTQIGQGYIAYHATETNAGGSTAIDFSKSNPVGNNEVFLSIPFKDIPKGTYEYLRVSLAYQNYIVVSLSTNKSFEWREVNTDNIWEPAAGENVVDMGIRGMLLQVQ